MSYFDVFLKKPITSQVQASHLKSDDENDLKFHNSNGKRDSLEHAKKKKEHSDERTIHYMGLYPPSRLKKWDPAPVVSEHPGLSGEMGKPSFVYVYFLSFNPCRFVFKTLDNTFLFIHEPSGFRILCGSHPSEAGGSLQIISRSHLSSTLVITFIIILKN